jgi:two-component system cell cycle sensor histidine kinase PleC
MPQARVSRARARMREPRGLAHLIACSNYRRLIHVEPLMRRSVPLLILAFIASVGCAIFLRLANERADLVGVARDEARVTAAALAGELVQSLPGIDATRLSAAAEELIERAIPARVRGAGLVIAITDARGGVVATTARDRLATGPPPAALLPYLRPGQARPSRIEIGDVELPHGQATAAAISVPAPFGSVLALQDHAALLAAWRGQATAAVSLFLTTAFVVLLLGFAFHWQAIRAREADHIYERASARIDTALTRGRCGLWDWDFARDRIYWSGSMFDVLGYAPRDKVLAFADIAELLHPDDAGLGAIAQAAVAGGQSTVDREFRLKAASGAWVWIRARGEIMRSPDGPHLIGIAVDVTEQKALAARSAEADLRLRDAVESISEAFVLWDSSNRIVTCNSKFQQLHGLPDAAIEPGTLYDDVLAAGRQPVITRRIHAEAESDACVFEAQLEDGRWLNISERRTKDGGFVSVGTDITSLKRHEEQLMQNDQQMRRTVDDLSRSQAALELKAHELAVMAQKYAEEKTRAEQANRTKSEFMANMSHELRTPLNAVIGFSELMQQGAFGPLGHAKYVEYCSDIRDSGQHLLAVINDILDMAKLDAARLDLRLEPVDLDEILDDAIRLVSTRADAKSIAIENASRPGALVTADRRALKQIALNLLSNAVKFTPEGGRVSVEARSAAGGIEVRVADSGIGIPGDMIPLLGRPFVQVENQYTKNHKGSGLGLAISRSLAELHGGELLIDSVVGRGTTVTVRLPTRQDREPGAEPAPSAAA